MYLNDVIDIAHFVKHSRLVGVVLPLSIDDEFVLQARRQVPTQGPDFAIGTRFRVS